MLLAFGADINPLNKYKRTPMDMCVGVYSYVDRTESLVEIVEVPSLANTAECNEVMSNVVDEVGTLLKECGGLLGCHVRHEQKRICSFVDFSQGEDKPEASASGPIAKPIETNDWCTKISKAYLQLETKLSSMLEDVNTSLVSESLDTAAALGLQIREMRLLQMGGSRILFLDGGGMKGLVEIEILSQIERRTGKRITELFDWIVGTSTGAIIALGLVYGECAHNAKGYQVHAFMRFWVL